MKFPFDTFRSIRKMKQKLLEKNVPVTGTVMRVTLQGGAENSRTAVYISFAPPEGEEQILRIVTDDRNACQVGQEIPLRCYRNDRDGKFYAIPESFLQMQD